MTTHSPVLASAVTLNSIIHLSNADDSKPQAVPIAKCGLPPNSSDFLSRWIDVTKSTLLFSKGVILVEGISEAMLIPELARRVIAEYNSKTTDEQGKLPKTLEDGGISVINMNGIYFDHFMQLFCDVYEQESSSIIIQCSGITDKDPPKDSKPTPSNLVTGNNRALKIVDKINKSKRARLFVGGLKTFEYDMAMEAGNMNEMFPVAKSLLDTDGGIKKQMEVYEKVIWASEKDETKRACAAYYLLTNIDKGEFSQNLADRLSSVDVLFSVPEYISNAVIWACGGNLDA